MNTCYHCAKIIKGAIKHTIPSNIAISLGIDFPKAFHPACYIKAENDAARALIAGQRT